MMDKILEELQACLDNPMSMDEMIEIGLVRVVDEPDYSLSVLRGLESRYGLSTLTVMRGLNSQHLLFEVPESDIRLWHRNWEIFLETGGNLALLGRFEPKRDYSGEWFQVTGDK